MDFRRIVTGHDADGNAVLISDAPPSHVVQVGGATGPTFFEIWETGESPARIDRQPTQPSERSLVLAPPSGGTRIRVIDFPPEGDQFSRLDASSVQAEFAAMGSATAHIDHAAPHPLMHRTRTVDYGLVLDGEITLILDRDETVIRTGDIVIQCGTSHAWSNRSGRHCRMAFVLIDGRCAEDGR